MGNVRACLLCVGGTAAICRPCAGIWCTSCGIFTAARTGFVTERCKT